MATYKTQRQLRLDDSVYLKIKAISKINSRSFNNQVEVILKDFVIDFEKNNGEIKVNPDDLYE